MTEVESLRQQLKKAEDHIKYLVLRDETWKKIDAQNKQQLANREAQIVMLRETVVQQNFWVEGALLCKEWQWCPDQRETAEGCLAYAKEALAATDDLKEQGK